MDSPYVFDTVVVILLYANNVVMLSKTKAGLLRLPKNYMSFALLLALKQVYLKLIS